VDAMSYVAMKRSKAPPSRVLGSGTALDTARLRYLIGRDLGIDPKSVHAYVLGEHGDSEMVAWSRAHIAGLPMEEWPDLDRDDRKAIAADVKGAAYQVIRMKGATYYAIALTLAKITEAVLKDSRTVFSVSTYLQGEYGIFGVYLGVPAIIGREGIVRALEVPLSRDELADLQESGRVVRKATESLGLGRRELIREDRRELVASGARFETAHELSPQSSAPRRPSRAKIHTVTKRPRKLV